MTKDEGFRPYRMHATFTLDSDRPRLIAEWCEPLPPEMGPEVRDRLFQAHMRLYRWGVEQLAREEAERDASEDEKSS